RGCALWVLSRHEVAPYNRTNAAGTLRVLPADWFLHGAHHANPLLFTEAFHEVAYDHYELSRIVNVPYVDRCVAIHRGPDHAVNVNVLADEFVRRAAQAGDGNRLVAGCKERLFIASAICA